VKAAGRVWLAIGVLTIGVVSRIPVRSEDALAGTSGHVAEARSEIDRLEKIIESLNRRIAGLDDALSALEARLADSERSAEPAAPLPMADCGDRDGEIRTVGGECEAARTGTPE
jgi:uncharacterized protein YlxW (UPF0749 family)